MNKNIFEIYKECSEEALLTELKGDNISISNIAPIEKSGPGDLVFVDKKEFVHHILKNKPSAAVIPAELIELMRDSSCTLLISSNVSLAQAIMKQKYLDRDLYTTE